MTNQTRRRALIFGLSAASILAAGRLGSALAATGNLAAPPGLANTGVADMRGWAATATSNMPVDNAGRTAFMKRKLGTAYTHPASSMDVRDKAVQQVLDRFGAQAQGLLDQPTPGGVGYGLFFNDAFKTAWGAGTSTTFDLVCPQPPGGNVDNFLYLTATNRASLGVEAFVSYYGQNDARFKVYDWALAPANPWQVDIALSLLGAYLHPSTNSSQAPQTVSVWNTTSSLGGRFYRNEVHLYNHLRHGWDLFYQYDYAATDLQQKTGWVGSWGPIVETFQPLYAKTNPMGATRTLLTESDSYGQWNEWSLLKPAESYVRNDNEGFSLRYVAPNFAFIAIS